MRTGGENRRVSPSLLHKHYQTIPPWKQLSHYHVSREPGVSFSCKRKGRNQPAVCRAPCPKSAKRDPKRPNGVDAGGQRVNDEEGDHPGPGAGVQSDSDRSRAAGPAGP